MPERGLSHRLNVVSANQQALRGDQAPIIEAGGNVGKHCVERWEVGVDVGDEGVEQA